MYLDTCPLYVTYPNGKAGNARNLYVAPGQTVTTNGANGYQTVDAPADPLDENYALLSEEDSFLTYFMFYPQTMTVNGTTTKPQNSIWVPLGYFSWVFDAEARNQGGAWTLLSATSNPAQITGTVFSYGAPQSTPPSFPEWTGTVFTDPANCQYPRNANVVTRSANHPLQKARQFP